MEKSKKITLAFLSLFQIVISGLFFVLGMVDGFEIRFVYVSLVFSPCWIVPLVLSNGIMGLVSIIIHKRSSLLIHAIWSVSVACIIYSAITVLRFQTWGVQLLLSNKIAGYYEHSGEYFVKRDFKLKYTKQENRALAVFSIIIVLSIIEIILAAALAKVSDSSQKGAQQPAIRMYAMHYQPAQIRDVRGQTDAGFEPADVTDCASPSSHQTMVPETRVTYVGSYNHNESNGEG